MEFGIHESRGFFDMSQFAPIDRHCMKIARDSHGIHTHGL